MEWFLPAPSADPIMRLRAQLFIVVSFLVTVNMGLFAALHTLHHLPGADHTSIAVMLGTGAVVATLPFLMRAGVSMHVLSLVFVVVLQVGVVVLACFDQGMLSGAVFWLVVTPLAASVLGGARLVWLAAFLSVAGGAGMFVASTLGWTFPSSLAPEKVALHHILSFVCCAGSVTALAALYEGPMASSLRTLAAQLRAMNEELERELAERRKAQGRAEAASRAKDIVLANMSHEFRTPLAAILGVTDLLMAETEGSHHDFLCEIDESAHRLRATLDGVLDMAWAESAGIEFEQHPVNVWAVVAGAVQGCRAKAAEKGLVLDIRGSHAVAEVNAEALGRVIGVLVDNAVRFTEAGSVVVSVWDAGSQATVEVADTGIGMDPDFVAMALEPFRQASQGDTRTHEGSGLGLALASRLVSRMRGTLDIASQPGRGTTVRLHVPTESARVSGDGGFVESFSPTLTVPDQPIRAAL